MLIYEAKEKLNEIADRLVPVAGALMQVACSQEQEHAKSCTCYLCRAFLGTHACINDLERIIRELEG